MKLKLLALMTCMLLVSGCDKVQSIAGGSVKCDDENAKQLVVEGFSKTVSDIASKSVKELIAKEHLMVHLQRIWVN